MSEHDAAERGAAGEQALEHGLRDMGAGVGELREAGCGGDGSPGIGEEALTEGEGLERR